jgi:iron complex transport system substrate-binding protein
MKDYLKDSLGAPAEALGIKVVYLNLETPETFITDVMTIGQIFGDSKQAEEITSYYQQSVSSVTDPLTNLMPTDKPGVLLLQYTSKGGRWRSMCRPNNGCRPI